MRNIFIAAMSAVMMCAASFVQADVFEQGRPSDTALRERLRDDRAGYYLHTPAIDSQEKEELVSEVSLRSTLPRIRPQGLRDMDKAFEGYMIEQLRKDRDYKDQVALSHPLLLLEYSSPVLADIIKHYRISTLERLAIDQSRLMDIERATESGADRLSRQSERECLIKNESRGLVAAMRLCQRSRQSFDALVSPSSGLTLEDGRRRIHVLAEALMRIGLDKSRIEKIVEIAGERVLADRKYEDRMPAVSFEARMAAKRQRLIRQWHEILEKFRSSARAGAAKLEDLSLPGVPVTLRTLTDIELLDDVQRELMIVKLASVAAFLHTAREYRQAASYLHLCTADPLLPKEFNNILSEKKEFLFEVLAVAESGRAGLVAYHDLLASINEAADIARLHLHERSALPSETRPLRRADVLLE